jgi:hypothetical protein
VNFISCPKSPLKCTSAAASDPLLKYYQDISESGNWKVFSKIHTSELEKILTLPDSIATDYLHLLTTRAK